MKQNKNYYVIVLVILLSFLLLLSITTSDGIYLRRTGITPYTLYGGFFFLIFLIRMLLRKKPIQAGKRRRVLSDIIHRVETAFPCRPQPYRIPEQIYTVLKDNPHEERAVSALILDIHRFLGMDTSDLRCDIRYIHDYGMEEKGDKDNPAGSYMDCGDGSRLITIYLRKRYNLYTVTSIVAHETMHHFLEKQKIKYTNIAENELLTDVATLYLGFEEYMVKGNTDLYDGGNLFRNVGYLSKSELDFVIRSLSKGMKVCR